MSLFEPTRRKFLKGGAAASAAVLGAPGLIRSARAQEAELGPYRSAKIDWQQASGETITVAVERDLSMKLLMGKTVVAEGSVRDAGEVAARLASEWRERKLRGEWKAELAARSDLAPDDRVERTVFVRAPRSIRYGEVARVIDAVKGAGAQPVGLQTDELPD